MKLALFVSALITALQMSAAAFAAPMPKTFTYANPLPFPGPDLHGELRDPCIIRDGDHYYLVFTQWPFTDVADKDLAKPDWNSSPGIQMYVSKNLTDWKPLAWLVKFSDLPDDSPYKGRFWAPEIHKFREKFYLIFYADNWIDSKYNGDGKPGYHAFIGVADHVQGPYEHITFLPESACDTTIFFDDDARCYAFMPFRDMYEQEVDLSRLTDGKLSYIGERRKVLDHLGTDIGQPSPRYLEGPWAIKQGKNRYCLFYAETYDRDYWTGVAYADNPLGPWRKDPRGRIFWGGHLSVFDGPDGRRWFGYREEKEPASRGKLCIDPFDIDSEGRIQPIGPTFGPQTVLLGSASKRQEPAKH